MTTAEHNRHLRELADQIAREVVDVLGFRPPGIRYPRCTRISRRRGWGYFCGDFSVPVWAATGPVEYFEYYVAHEVIHTQISDTGHGPMFRALEAKALASRGLAPVYENCGRGPYVDALTDLATGRTVALRNHPRNPIAAPAEMKI